MQGNPQSLTACAAIFPATPLDTDEVHYFNPLQPQDFCEIAVKIARTLEEKLLSERGESAPSATVCIGYSAPNPDNLPADAVFSYIRHAAEELAHLAGDATLRLEQRMSQAADGQKRFEFLLSTRDPALYACLPTMVRHRAAG